MFISRRLGRRLFAGGVPAQAIASSSEAAAPFHTSRALRIHTKMSDGVVPRNAALLHDEDGLGAGSPGRHQCHGDVPDDLDARTQRSDVHGVPVEGDESTYKVSIAHAATVVSQATKALNSLLGHSRLSSTSVAADADSENRLVGGEAPAAAEGSPDADEAGRAVTAGGPLHPTSLGTGGCGSVEVNSESNGEEEILENRWGFADEVEPVLERGAEGCVAVKCTPPTTASLSSHETATPQLTNADELRSAELGATPYGARHPVNLFGSRYCDSMADTLRYAAESRRFLSPFWSSREAFERVGAVVTAEEDEGVLLPISISTSVRLFNLEQTSLAKDLRAATASEVLMRLRVLRERRDIPCSRDLGGDRRPLNLIGRAFSFQRADAIITSPHFLRLQKQSPYWVSVREMEAIGATVRPEEVECFAEGPHLPCRHFPQSTLGIGADVSPPGGTRAHSTIISHPNEAASTEGVPIRMRYYNLSQLGDAGRFAQLDPVRNRLARCFGIHGTPYTASTTWLMWEYCARHHFPLRDEPQVVFLTMERVFRLGGSIAQTKRYPIACPLAGRVDDTGTTTITSSSSGIGGATSAGLSEAPLSSSVTVPASEDISATRHGGMDAVPACGGADGRRFTSADTGVVPPPFTMLVGGEVMSVFNALQTDIADIIFDRVFQLRDHRCRNWGLKV
ncbi:hypothetical protein JKF63_05273 [Porcisia hertigi]|uniref:Trypanosoma Tc-38 (p38) protein domain-containing protein n=1 Tax=Porcisia hertigi TaxID=2761500 RepID=A0A836LGV6_9TRYP|nr:hypothetical protein JKF63_05273 [Porcisia hertigi]